MATTSVDQDVLRAIGEFGRPVRFGEVAEKLLPKGLSRSQVHNAVYRLGKSGRLTRAGSGAAMTYIAVS